jgi:3',5'-cyclic AMP phosphodiesterase CpdA
LAASAGAVLSPALFAATKPANPNLWAFLSDTHVAANRSLKARGVNMAENFESVSKEVLGMPERPAGVLINGDCAFNMGLAGDYTTLGDLLEPIRSAGMGVHLSVGNHDEREHFWTAFPKERPESRPVAERQTAVLQTNHANWFVLDSLETTGAAPGLLGKEQLSWLAQALDANSKKPALVFVHHNPGIDGNIGLRDSLALFEIIRPRRHVKAYVFGHTHLWKLEKDTSGLHLINLPPVAYVFQPGNPSGWVRALEEANGMALELRCVDTMHRLHGEKVKLEWRT